MNKNQLKYPIKFIPILKEKIWGGNKLTALLNKANKNNIGESWEISGVKDNVSIVSNGLLKGKSLKELITTFEGAILGHKVFKSFGNNFPLLFKFIDANKDLSVQLHPNDQLAKKQHNSFGKNEMWYVLGIEEGAKLILGFSKQVDQEIYQKHLVENTLSEILQYKNVKKGDSFFIETGLVHAIGNGVVLAEIQQTSDVTYRIYDWDRKAETGEKRELHTEMALEAIQLSNKNGHKIDYTISTNSTSNIISTNYFNTNIVAVEGEISKDYTEKDCFLVLLL